jgi:hypothetical protein
MAIGGIAGYWLCAPSPACSLDGCGTVANSMKGADLIVYPIPLAKELDGPPPNPSFLSLLSHRAAACEPHDRFGMLSGLLQSFPPIWSSPLSAGEVAFPACSPSILVLLRLEMLYYIRRLFITSDLASSRDAISPLLPAAMDRLFHKGA